MEPSNMLNQRKALLHNNITLLQMQDPVQVMNILVRVTEILPFIIHSNMHLSNGLFQTPRGMLLPRLILHQLRQVQDQDLRVIIILIVRNPLLHHTAVRLLRRHTRHPLRLILLRPVPDVVKHQVQVPVQAQAHQVEVLLVALADNPQIISH